MHYGCFVALPLLKIKETLHFPIVPRMIFSFYIDSLKADSTYPEPSLNSTSLCAGHLNIH